MKRSEKQAGFSLVEVVFVVAVSLVMTAFTAKSMTSAVQRYQSDAAARGIASLAQLAVLKASSQATRYRLLIDPATGIYTLQRYDRSTTAWETDPKVTSQSLPRGITFDSSGVSTAPPEQSSASQAAEMAFNSRGLLCDSSTGALLDGACFYLHSQAGSPRAVCTTVVGRSVVYEWTGTVWNKR